MKANECENLSDEWWVIKYEWWVMSDEWWKLSDGNWVMKICCPNRPLVFSVSEIWVIVAKSELCDWVMWPNNNFEVFEIKWGFGWVMGFELELWVMSIEL